MMLDIYCGLCFPLLCFVSPTPLLLDPRAVVINPRYLVKYWSIVTHFIQLCALLSRPQHLGPARARHRSLPGREKITLVNVFMRHTRPRLEIPRPAQNTVCGLQQITYDRHWK